MKSLTILTAMTALLAACSGPSTGLNSPTPPSMAPQQMSWSHYCSNGASQFCASIELQLVPDNMGRTAVTVRMRNLEGTEGTTPWRLQNLAFAGLATDDTTLGRWFYPAQAKLTGSGTFYVDADSTLCANFTTPRSTCPKSTWGETEWYTFSSATAGRGGFYWTINGSGDMTPSMVGCGVPTTNPSNSSIAWGAFQTCGNGWVEIVFTLPGSWVFDAGSQMSWVAYSDQGTVSCFAGSGCSQSAAGINGTIAAARSPASLTVATR